MGKKSERAREIQNAINDILWRYWDPICVNDNPQCSYEYDSYVGGIYRLLASGADKYKIIHRLHHLERTSMGIASDLKDPRLDKVATKLLELNINL